jgi:hypothetical protein
MNIKEDFFYFIPTLCALLYGIFYIGYLLVDIYKINKEDKKIRNNRKISYYD